MKVFSLFSVITILLIFSCKQEGRDGNKQSEVENKVSIIDTLSLKLNADQKWLVNTETHIGVTKMDSIITDFESQKNMGYIALGNALSKQTSYIIKNCTMTGEPHDQLHVVLVPMLDEISIMRESKNDKESENALKTLKDLIQAYYEYFKL